MFMELIIILFVLSLGSYLILHRPWEDSLVKKPEQTDFQGNSLIESSKELAFHQGNLPNYPWPPEQINWGSSSLVLLPRSPKALYTYWDFDLQSENNFHNLLYQCGYGTRTILRIFQLIDSNLNDSKLSHLFDVDIDPNTNNWYLNVPFANASYCLELGLLTPNGHFVLLLRSQVVTMPRDDISPHIDPDWLPLSDILGSFNSESSRSSYDLAQNTRKD